MILDNTTHKARNKDDLFLWIALHSAAVVLQLCYLSAATSWVSDCNTMHMQLVTFCIFIHSPQQLCDSHIQQENTGCISIMQIHIWRPGQE